MVVFFYLYMHFLYANCSSKIDTRLFFKLNAYLGKGLTLTLPVHNFVHEYVKSNCPCISHSMKARYFLSAWQSVTENPLCTVD